VVTVSSTSARSDNDIARLGGTRRATKITATKSAKTPVVSDCEPHQHDRAPKQRCDAGHSERAGTASGESIVPKPAEGEPAEWRQRSQDDRRIVRPAGVGSQRSNRHRDNEQRPHEPHPFAAQHPELPELAAAL